jgi:hypothetical protein
VSAAPGAVVGLSGFFFRRDRGSADERTGWNLPAARVTVIDI